jgi:hypothetical protein
MKTDAHVKAGHDVIELDQGNLGGVKGNIGRETE